ncbi:MAG: FtsX-like permease family protein [Candidatus Lokiarchaeota archaeon]|nr:FtsX-like permease family protein [Candidatus Lokiarchaeota archaeon]
MDFAIKDFYRKRETTYSYTVMIILVIAFTVFLINFTSAIGFNTFITYGYENAYYFSGGIAIVYTDFTTLVIVLMLIMAFAVVVIVTSTLIITKKRDIAIMKALGSLPRKLYSFYLTEAYLVFIIGFIMGAIIGYISYGILSFVTPFFGIFTSFQIDFIYTPILFFSCLAGIYVVPGVILRKIGTQNTIKLFSKDIPYSYDGSKKFSLVPRWLSLIGYNFKMSLINTIRRKGEFKRYLVVFTIISLIVFTLGLGSSVLSSSSQEWITKSQGRDVIAIGHKHVIQNYTSMYSMFSNPEIIVTKNDIDFLDPNYLFNFSTVGEIGNISEIEKVDQRLINFFDTTELDGYHFLVDGGYVIAGQQRKASIPIIGLNTSDIIQNFEMDGTYFEESDPIYMMIGDGLGHNFFDYPLDQSMRIDELGLGHSFHISGVLIDSFYSGFAGYVDLGVMQGELNFSSNEINLLLLKVKHGEFNNIVGNIKSIINETLGENFSFVNLNTVFENNYDFLNNLTFYPALIIIMMAIISIVSLYNYQKGNILEKAKDFLIMRAVGSQYKSIKRILFLEALYILIPSLLLSLGIGMILNSTILLYRTYLPHISIPFFIGGILFVAFLIFNYLSLFPILRRIKKFTIKDFEMY